MKVTVISDVKFDDFKKINCLILRVKFVRNDNILHIVKDSPCRQSRNADSIFRLDQIPTLAF